MKKRRIIITLTILLLLVGAYIIICYQRINSAKELIDTGTPYTLSSQAPGDDFYKGIEMLLPMTWLPYYGDWAEEIITVQMSSTGSEYFVDYMSYMASYYHNLCDERRDQYDSLKAANEQIGLYTALLEYPEMNTDSTLNLYDAEVFCTKWGRYERLMDDIYKQDSLLLIFTRETYGDCP